MLVAVYGSLRRGLSNYKRFLVGEKYVGLYETEPKYGLYDLGSYPGLKKGGLTSVVMEVFEVGLEKLAELDTLEGYDIDKKNAPNYYDREPLETPFGTAFVYFYSPHLRKSELEVTSGDWKLHLEKETLANHV